MSDTPLLITCALLALCVLIQSARAARLSRQCQNLQRSVAAQADALRAARHEQSQTETRARRLRAEAAELHATLDTQVAATLQWQERATSAEADLQEANGELARLKLRAEGRRVFLTTPKLDVWEGRYGALGVAPEAPKPGFSLADVLTPLDGES